MLESGALNSRSFGSHNKKKPGMIFAGHKMSSC